MSLIRPSTPMKTAPLRPFHQLNQSNSDVSHPTHRSHRPTIHHPHLYHPHLHRHDKEDKYPTTVTLASHTNLLSERLDGGTGDKFEGVTQNHSRAGSRSGRASVSGIDEQVVMPKKKPIQDGEVKVEKERNLLRIAQLQQTISDLNTQAHTTTNDLDNTYYSILEKMNFLQNTISTFRELAILTRGVNSNFDTETSSLIRETSRQIDAFQSFDLHEQRIADLQERISEGREKVSGLGVRVNAVQQKIDRWEKVESEWGMRTRKRLQVLWVMGWVVVFVVLGGLIFQYAPAKTTGPGVLKGINMTNFTLSIPELEARLENQTGGLKRTSHNALEKLLKAPEPEGEDPRLRMFDEL